MKLPYSYLSTYFYLSFTSTAMLRNLLALVLPFLLSMATHAQSSKKSLADNKKSAYLMVYHKDADHGLHLAYSWDGRTWTAFNNDQPIMLGDTIAEQKGIRDPYIFRGPDGSVYIAMTDLHVFGERDGVRTTRWERPDEYGWGNNRGLVLLKSSDIIHWKRTNLDFTKIVGGDSIIRDWKDVGCVWAPEMNWDDQRQQIMMHFTTRYKNGRNVLYYTYMNDDFTDMTELPRLLFAVQDAEGHITAPTIDSDITRIGDTYHLLMVQFGYVKHATSKHLTGPYIQDNLYNDGETQRHEAPCAFRLNGTNRYVVMFDNYSREPHNFGFVETTDFHHFTPIGYFDEENSPMHRTNFSEQKHAGVIAVSRKELRRLIKYWKKSTNQ